MDMRGVSSAAVKHRISPEEWLARRAAGRKWCYRCQMWHPISEFYADASKADKLDTQCKAQRKEQHARAKRSKGRPRTNLPAGAASAGQARARDPSRVQAQARAVRPVL